MRLSGSDNGARDPPTDVLESGLSPDPWWLAGAPALVVVLSNRTWLKYEETQEARARARLGPFDWHFSDAGSTGRRFLRRVLDDHSGVNDQKKWIMYRTVPRRYV